MSGQSVAEVAEVGVLLVLALVVRAGRVYGGEWERVGMVCGSG